LNGVSHVQSERRRRRRRRRLRERRCDGSEQVLREYTLQFKFLQFVEKLVWQWVVAAASSQWVPQCVPNST
jgi:hypothetical protein